MNRDLAYLFFVAVVVLVGFMAIGSVSSAGLPVANQLYGWR